MGEAALRYACDLDGKGGAREIGWDEIRRPAPPGIVRWIHLHVEGDEAEQWLRQESGLDEIVCDALLAETTRPRMTQLTDGLLVILRGANLNPDSDPEDMVGIRILLQKDRIVTLRIRKLKTTEDIRNYLARGEGPTDPGDFIVRVAERLTERLEPVVETLDEQLGAIEEDIFSARGNRTQDDLAGIRYSIITLIRHLSPQYEALKAMSQSKAEIFEEEHRHQIGEIADITLRYMEDLNAMRERAGIVYDEIRTRLSERLNQTMYLLTVVAAVLLPPSLIAGILGINVGGMPGVESPYAFSIVVVLLAALCGFELWLIRRLGWI